MGSFCGHIAVDGFWDNYARCPVVAKMYHFVLAGLGHQPVKGVEMLAHSLELRQ